MTNTYRMETKNHHHFGAQTENRNGQYVPAIPEPYFLLFQKQCNCGQKFWTEEGYRAHFAYKHILCL